MSKNKQVPEQVHAAPERVPTQATGTTRGRTPSQRQTSGTQAHVTSKATPVGSDEQEQVQAQAEPMPNNITDIRTARNRHARQESTPDSSDGQLCQNDPERKIGAVEGQIEGTGETGTDLAELGANNRVRTGRKPGTKDAVPRKKRTDFNISEQVPADEKQMIVRYNVELFNLGKLNDPNDYDEVRERLAAYFSISDRYQQVPTVAGMALALGIDRRTLWTWMEQKVGTIKNPAVMDTLKRVYNMISSQYEGLLTQGKIVPVAGFFLMQNNFGYKNQTDHVVVAQQAEDPNTDDLAARAGLLDADTGADGAD